MKPPFRSDYQVVTGLSVLGIAAIACLTSWKASGDFELWRHLKSRQTQIRLSGELEKTKAEVTREVADAYRRNQVGQFDQLIVEGYVYGATPPNLDWSSTVDPNTKTIILDKYRKCAGVAYRGKYVHAYPDTQACRAREE